jgi:hypothetical protein
LEDLELRSADPFDAGGAAPHPRCLVKIALRGSCSPLSWLAESRRHRRHPEDVYDPAVASREREIREHAVHALTRQAATADYLVDEALDDEAVVVGTAGPIR